jgi:C1A family cysteine protease
MQLRTKWGALVLVALLLGSLGTAGLVFAKSVSSAPAAQTSASSSLPATLQTAPLNPAYVQYQQEKAAGKVATQTVDGHGLGWVPPPYELSKLPSAPSLLQAQTYQATYDLRTYNKVSPVEDQGNCGSCWTFATFGSLESYLLPGLTTQYSENNLKNLADFTYTCCYGGDATMSTAYLARWGTTMTDNSGSKIYAGPVTSAFDPYSVSCTSSPTTSQIAMHVQNVYFLPLKTSQTDNNAIKSALTTYGGVYSAFWWDPNTSTNVQSTYWNPSTAAYYDRSTTGGNHAVTIVGWDDSFSAKNFATTPPGDGAWIVKNSWGTSFGKSGYFYVSYYDKNMGSQENAVFTAEPTTNYTTNYQYDPFGMEGGVGSGSSSTAYGANVFAATSTGTLKAVSFWAPVANTQYTAQVYVNPTNPSNPTSGTLMSTISGTVSNAGFSYAGYYTESLSTTVPLTKGEKFAVVVKFTTPGDDQPVPVQQRVGGTDDNNAPNAVTSQSFYSLDGTTWNDLAVTYGAANSYVANIHAFESGPITVASSPAVTAQNANSLDLFVNGTDSALYHKYWTGTTWTASTSLGGIITSSPAATSRSSGTIDVFARGSDGVLWSRTTTDGGATWNAWHSIGGQVPSGTGPAADAQNANSLDVFVQGTDHALWYTHWDGTTWSGWKSLGGIITSSPAATSRSSGTIDVFARGSDGVLWSRTTTDGGATWNAWHSIGGQVPSGTGPAADAQNANSLDVFVQGTDHALWYTHWDGTTWSGWKSLGGVLPSSPAATSPANGVIDVFVRGTDHALWERSYNNGVWGAWASIGGL